MNHTAPSAHQSGESLPLDFNWNIETSPLSEVPNTVPASPTPSQVAGTQLLSECLRDGLQGIKAYPKPDDMMRYLHLLDEFGITYATVGIYPGSAETLNLTMKDVLARMRDELPEMVPSVLSLCTEDSLKWSFECREIHPRLESVVFMGSAPSRRLVQGWELDFIVDKLGTFIRRTVNGGMPVIAGTEHTTQTSPEDLRAILEAQVQGGAYRVGVADTIGVIRPLGTYRIVAFLRAELDRLGTPEVQLDWHGHRDTGNDLGNALMATAAGADRLHVVSRGIGERSGNASLETIALNYAAILQEHGLQVPWHMPKLLDLITFYQDMVDVPSPDHGVLGQRYNHTSSGIHADAIERAHAMADKAREAGDVILAGKLRGMARTVYSAVDPAAIGGAQSVSVSPWSGKSAVRLSYRAAGNDPADLSPELVDRVLAHASELGREMTDEELANFFTEVGPGRCSEDPVDQPVVVGAPLSDVPRTMFEKIWEAHVVRDVAGETPLIYIDRHLTHEATSPQAFTGLRERGLTVRRPETTIAVVDHNVPTVPGRTMADVVDSLSAMCITTMEDHAEEFGVELLSMNDEDQGIVHVVGPELGLSLPGMTLVCGDSHTSTHGALGIFAIGIGTSEVEHVLATQCLQQERPKTMNIRLEGRVRPQVTAKDLALHVIGELGTDVGNNHIVEFTGAAVRSLSIEGRMTLCNMSIEAGARGGMVAPDDVTIEYVRGRRHAPTGDDFDHAAAAWRALASDPGATYDAQYMLDVTNVGPQVTWGTNPGMVVDVGGAVPDPAAACDDGARRAMERALAYMGLEPGRRIQDIPVQVVFIGSCTNSRIEDLRAAAAVVAGHKVASDVRAMVVPGSMKVSREAEAEGLAEVFRNAGFEWRTAGCSMCIAVNGDSLASGERCASTSNRNFEGRQGRGGRTHLVSPATAAATAIAGHFADPSEL